MLSDIIKTQQELTRGPDEIKEPKPTEEQLEPEDTEEIQEIKDRTENTTTSDIKDEL